MSKSTYSFGSSTDPCRLAPDNVQRYAEEAEEKEDFDPEKLLQCPFDINHKIRSSRFPYHLLKCRKNHPKLASELKTCPFNARHLIPKHELSHHTATCVDKKSAGCYEPSSAEEPRKWQMPVSKWINPQTDEDWDQEADDFATPFIWGTSSTNVLQPEVTNGFTHELNLSAGLRAPKTLPFPDNFST